MVESKRDDDKLIVLATFSNSSEAQLLRVALENDGIRASVANEQSASLLGASMFGPTSAFWVEVLVFNSDSEEALAIKHRIFPEGETETVPEWTCPCGETVDAGFEICWSCSSPYKNE